jgi:4-amino-4-deoxy-L-arabinose transferase-like glycosyltransferase
MAISIPFQLEKMAGRWLWLTWSVIMLTVFIIHWSTLGIAPFLHKDEFLIVDLGRIILHPETDWSIAWVANQNQPVFFLCYVGPVLQELSFQLIGEYGPRISATIGALVAATILIKWLISKGTSQDVALILGIVFLVDPIFVQAYGLGRVDSWMMAFCLASCWILADLKPSYSAHFNCQIILAGALFAVAFFVWPTAVFFLPLVFWELILLVRKNESEHRDWKSRIFSFAYFAIGALSTGFVLLMPILPLFQTDLFNLTSMESNVGAGISKSGIQLVEYIFSQLIEIFRFLKFSVILLLVAAVYALRKRQTGLIIALVVVVILMTFTKVYVHRVQYLLPYLIALIAGASYLNEHANYSRDRIIRKVYFSALLIWPLALSIFARTVLANSNSEERNRKLLYNAAQSMIGVGNPGVFSSWEFYYSGRSLGWKMYVTYDVILSVESLRPILPHIDYAIVPRSEVTKEIASLLHTDGMHNRGSYFIYSSPREKDTGSGSNVNRLRNLFSIMRKPYGPYIFYVRD